LSQHPSEWKIIVFAGLFSIWSAPFSCKFLTLSAISGDTPAAGASFGWPVRLQAEWFKDGQPLRKRAHFYSSARAPT
jgi:hypothetical protein